MGEIPESIVDAAIKVYDDGEDCESRHEAIMMVAEAIYAERQRCAKIAEDYAENISYGKYANTAAAEKAARTITQAILADKEES